MNDSRRALLRHSSFRWHLSGSALSMVGDQFTILATPWLVLKMTNDPLSVGLVLAVNAAPRVLLMLFGGAVVDHYSSKQVLLVGRFFNTALLGLFAGLLFWSEVNIWIAYAIAFGCGVTSAFSIPAGRAILLDIVSADCLQAANSLMDGVRQLTIILVPPIAGMVIAFFGEAVSGAGYDADGFALAFSIDAATFAVSIFTLMQVRVSQGPANPHDRKHTVE